MVLGIHQYYGIATCINLDSGKIAYPLKPFINHRLPTKKKGKILNAYIEKQYGKSKEMRWLNNVPIVPFNYVKFRLAVPFSEDICKYTQHGRDKIHSKLQTEITTIMQMMKDGNYEKSIEYVDNRISKYSAQKGKCAVTGIYLKYQEIHCHHILPVKMGGTDKYDNLIILHEDIHKLIHAVEPALIEKYLAIYNLSNKQIKKLNNLRVKAGNSVLKV